MEGGNYTKINSQKDTLFSSTSVLLTVKLLFKCAESANSPAIYTILLGGGVIQ